MRSTTGGGRAVSTALGVVLLVGVVVVLSVVAGTFFLGIGQDQPSEVPDVSATIEFDDGGDGTFTDAGSGGVCSGSAGDNDGVIIDVVAAPTIPEDNYEIKVGSATADTGTCTGATAGVDYYTSSPSPAPPDLSGDTTIDVRESDGTNPIRPGAKVRLIWNDPESDESYVLVEATVPDR